MTVCFSDSSNLGDGYLPSTADAAHELSESYVSNFDWISSEPFPAALCYRTGCRIVLHVRLPRMTHPSTPHQRESRPKNFIIASKLAKFRWRLHRRTHRLPEQSIDRIHPENLAAEHGPEIPRHRLGHCIEINFVAHFFLHRCDRLGHDAAWHDEVEVTEISIHIEREAVRSHATRDVYPDRGNLGFDAALR